MAVGVDVAIAAQAKSKGRLFAPLVDRFVTPGTIAAIEDESAAAVAAAEPGMRTINPMISVKSLVRNALRKRGYQIQKYPTVPFAPIPIFDLSVQLLMAIKGESSAWIFQKK